MTEHQCQYRDELEKLRAIALQQQAAIARQQADIAQLKKALLGPKSERMPAIKEVLGKKADPAKTKAKRAAKKKAREDACIEELDERVVPDEERTCPSCGDEAKTVSSKVSTVYHYVPARFVLRRIHRETVACDCGGYMKTAAAPERVLGQSKYSADFVAMLVTEKLLDSTPIYRQEKRFKRIGMPVARSTMNDLVQKCGEELKIIHRRMLHLIAEQGVVLADETSLPVVKPKKCKRGFVWAFSARVGTGPPDDAPILIAHKYSKDRSGQTPTEILGESEGVLVVDGYTGYNKVTAPGGRVRAACLAHVRRKFFDARKENEAVADEVLALILDVYRVEHLAKERGIVRTAAHAKLRDTQGRAAMDALNAWLTTRADAYPPRSSALGNAIRYALKNWAHLCVFLDDVEVPVDNNASERHLRPVAKGRDNWMFAGNDGAAERLMALLGICATCEANGINPQEYIADVLCRVEHHPVSQLDELLPHLWKPAVRPA